MDLELSDEQGWLSESLETLLTARWLPPERRTPRRRRATPAVGRPYGVRRARRGVGAVELCLVGPSLGARWRASPSSASAALRYAGADVDGPFALGL